MKMDDVQAPRERGELSEAPEECVGYTLQDLLGQRIGRIESIFSNRSGEPEYVRVKLGLFWSRSVILPVEWFEVDHDRRVLRIK